MKQRLINHIQSVTCPTLRKTCESILTYEKFFVWPASLSHHHAYEGGLLAHTVEVCDIAMCVAGAATTREVFEGCPIVRQNFVAPDTDILIAAALWHDVMKVEEYEDVEFDESVKYKLIRKHPDMQPMTMWITTDYQKRIGHIAGSAAEFQKSAWINNVPTDTIDELTQCILSQHGRK